MSNELIDDKPMLSGYESRIELLEAEVARVGKAPTTTHLETSEAYIKAVGLLFHYERLVRDMNTHIALAEAIND